MKVAGIDFDTHRADLVLIPIDPGPATWRRFHFDAGKKSTALDRVRLVRDQLPSRTYWDAEGVILIAVEDPRTHGARRMGADAMYRTQGALIATLPSRIDVWELPAFEWRRTLGLKASGKRDALKQETAAYATPLIEANGWRSIEPELTQDALDAYCIALAALRMLSQASEAA